MVTMLITAGRGARPTVIVIVAVMTVSMMITAGTAGRVRSPCVLSPHPQPPPKRDLSAPEV